MLACGVAATARAQDGRSREIVLLTAVDPSVAGSDDIREGLAFGAAEAARLAALLQHASRVVDVGHDGAALRAALAGRPRAGAMIAALTPAGLRQLVGLDPALPVLAIVNHAPAVRHPRLFTIAWSGGLTAAAQPSAESRARPLEAWHPSLFRYGAGELNERFARAAGRPMSSAAWAGWTAVKAAMEAAIRAGGGTANVTESLKSLRFDAHKGRALRFDECGRLVQPMYRVQGDAVVEQQPAEAGAC